MPYRLTSHVLPFADGFNRYQTPINLSVPLSSIAPRVADLMRVHIDSGHLANVAPVIVFELFNTGKRESVPGNGTAFWRRDWEGMASGGVIYGWDSTSKANEGDVSGCGEKQREEVARARGMVRQMVEVTAGRDGGDKGEGRDVEHRITYPSYCKFWIASSRPDWLTSLVQGAS